MRVLVVSNFYPPHFLGGYELGCRRVVESLKSRGHAVRVLTSTYGLEGGRPQDDAEASRRLALTDEARGRGRALLDIEARNRAVFARLGRRFRPDVVYFWNMGRLSLSLVHLADKWGLSSRVFVSDHWLAEWREDAWTEYLSQRHPRHLLSRLAWAGAFAYLRLRGMLPPGEPPVAGVQFCSAFLRNEAARAGLPVAGQSVIHWGVESDVFPFRNAPAPATPRLLYVGQVMAHKGVHTAVEALARLRAGGRNEGLTLTVAGGSSDPAYAERLAQLAAQSGVGGSVSFVGPVTPARLPELYHAHDILVFPSCWEEPFAITPLEAMSCGLAVVGTTTGGSPEIFRDGVNALTFPAGDADACARQVARLAGDAALWQRIRAEGARTVAARFRLEQMVDKIEDALASATTRPRPVQHVV